MKSGIISMTAKRILVDGVGLSIRALSVADIPFIVNYWLQSSPENLVRMGVDTLKIPTASQFEEGLRSLLEQDNQEAKTSYRIWHVDDLPIGFSSLKNIQYEQRGEMHLHIWNSSFIGRGYGPILFCLSAQSFYDTFKLKAIKCEPRASNPFPNRMLQKIGFPFVGSRVGASSELSLSCELNQYTISLDTASRYLQSAGIDGVNSGMSA